MAMSRKIRSLADYARELEHRLDLFIPVSRSLDWILVFPEPHEPDGLQHLLSASAAALSTRRL
jgi:hypothetical protein